VTGRRVTGRRVSAGAIGLAALLGLTLGGCKQDNTPNEYNTLTNQNFLETCTNYYFDNTNDTLAITSNTVKADVTPPTQDQCQCQYEVYVNNMPINKTAAKESQYANYTGPNFTDLNAQLKTDPQKGWDSVPQDLKDQVNACTSTGGSGGSTTTTTSSVGDASTTTTAAAG
jgi:hypothetical protein